jgi:hypothetical protein
LEIKEVKLFDKVCYVSREVQLIKDLLDNDVFVQDTFPYDVASKTAGTTARAWGSQTRRHGGEVQTPTMLERDNTPFSITIVNLEYRCEGGRAYKVIDDEHRQFDLREDQIIEIFRHAGIKAGGCVNGQFVWGTAGSQTKMVLVGGELYTKMKEETEKQKQLIQNRKLGIAPRASTLRVGHVYKKHNNDCYLFVGKVFLDEDKKPAYAFVRIPNEPKCYANIDLAGISGSGWTQRSKDIITWYKSIDWDATTVRERCKNLFYEYNYNITFLSSPKFDEEINLIDVDYASEIRDNNNLTFGYQNGFDEDLVEKMCQNKNIVPVYYKKRDYGWGVSGQLRNDFSSDNQEHIAARKELRQQYAQQLRWVVK